MGACRSGRGQVRPQGSRRPRRAAYGGVNAAWNAPRRPLFRGASGRSRMSIVYSLSEPAAAGPASGSRDGDCPTHRPAREPPTISASRSLTRRAPIVIRFPRSPGCWFPPPVPTPPRAGLWCHFCAGPSPTASAWRRLPNTRRCRRNSWPAKSKRLRPFDKHEALVGSGLTAIPAPGALSNSTHGRRARRPFPPERAASPRPRPRRPAETAAR